MHPATKALADDYLATGEAAHLLGVSVRTVWRYTADGRLTPHKTPGGHRRYSRAEVLALRSGVAPLPAAS